MQALKVTSLSEIIAAMKDIDLHGFAARLNEALDDMDFPKKGRGRQVELGKMFKVGQKAARKWLEGEGLPKPSRIGKVAHRLNVSVEWLLNGKGPKRPTDEQVTSANQARTAPLSSWAQVASGAPPSMESDRIPVPADAGPNVFALAVEGDSMEPEFQAGEVIVVDPDLKAVPGRFVVAILANGSPTFKRLTQDAGVMYLKPLSPQYQAVALTPADTIVGTVTHKVSVHSYL